MTAQLTIEEGTPNLCMAQRFAETLAMTLNAELAVPEGLTPEQARQFVEQRLSAAIAAVPELSFSVLIGTPDL